MLTKLQSARAEWLARDRLPFAEMIEGSNLYWYVGNNQINFIDVLGLLSGAAQQAVNSALAASDGDLQGALDDVILARQGNEKCQALVDADHYLQAAIMARGSFPGASLLALPATLIIVPVYAAGKAVLTAAGALPPTWSQPSASEIEAGEEGAFMGATEDPVIIGLADN